MDILRSPIKLTQCLSLDSEAGEQKVKCENLMQKNQRQPVYLNPGTVLTSAPMFPGEKQGLNTETFTKPRNGKDWLTALP